MPDKELKVRYGADAGQLLAEQRKIEQSAARMGSTFSRVGTGLKNFGSSARQIGRSMSVGLTLPIVAFGAKAVSAFRESQAAAAATEAVIRSTGGAAGVTAAQVGKLATSMQNLTAFEDEAVQQSSNLLLTFTNIGSNVFPQATMAILDMATAMNKGSSVGANLEATTIQVGKALQDPIKGITALSRVGVNFTAQQKKQIKAMVESGDVMGAQKLILAELNKEFGGMAAAFAGTDAGKQAQEMNKLGDAFEKIGAAISPIVSKVAGFIAGLATAFTSLSPGMQTVILVAAGVAAALGPIITVVGAVATAIGFLISPIGLVVVAIGALIAVGILVWRHWDTIKAGLVAAWNGIKAAAVAVFNFLKFLFLNFTPLGQIIQHWNTIRTTLLTIWNAIKGAASAVWNAITGVIGAAVNTARAVIVAVWNAIRGALSAVWNGIRGAASSVWGAITGVISSAVGRVRSIVSSVASFMRGTLGAAFNAIRGFASGAWNAVVGAFRRAYNTIAAIVRRIKETFCNLPFVPCSPIPLVTDAKAAVGGVLDAFKTLDRQLPRTLTVSSNLGSIAGTRAASGPGRVVSGPANVTFNITGGDSDEIVRKIQDALLRMERRSGPIFARS